jgi:PAS domain S-box-containing protein
MPKKPTYEELKKRCQRLERSKARYKRSEKTMQATLDRYRSVVDFIPTLICSSRPGGEISFVNKAYCNYFGKPLKQLVGSNFLSLIPEAGREAVMNNISALTVESPIQSHEHLVIDRNGHIRWQRWTNRAIFDDRGKVVGYQSIGEDITERKEAQEALRESEELHRITLSNITDTVFIADDAGAFTYICPNVSAIFGYRYEEVAAFKNIEALLGSNLFDRVQLEAAGELRNLERVITDKSGEVHILLVNVKRVSIKGGTVLYTCHEITDRKYAEDALKISEERFRRIFEDIVVGIFRTTSDGRIIHVNPAFARMFGYASPADLMEEIGDSAERLYAHPGDRTKLIRRVMSHKAPITAEINFCRRDGTPFVGNFHGWKVPEPTDGTLHLEGFIEDITERKLAEDSLQESYRRLQFLSARLLRSQENEQRRISLEIHDVMGQDLALLKMHLVGIAKRLRKDQQKLKSDLNNTLTVVDEIIAKARNLSRDLSPAIIEDLKLSGAIRWLIHDFEEHIESRISLEMEPVDHLFSTESQIVLYRIIQEALKNIVKHSNAATASVIIREEPRSVLLRIEDDGKGFDVASMQNRQVTDRGLGLAAMDERGRMLGGIIEIQSTRGCGTCISLRIPIGKELGNP